MWILNILLLIFILGLLIFIHELGHFLAAKKSGVHIYEFALGMGPVILSKKGKDGVLYQWRLFPIGGFVQMAGEVNEDDNAIPKEKFMCNRPWYQRVIILVAGVVMNFLLAIVILFSMSLIWGHAGLDPVIGTVEQGYAADMSGFKEDDRIVEINGYKIGTWDKARIVLALEHEGDHKFVLQSPDGSKRTINLKPSELVFGFELDNDDFLKTNGEELPIVNNVVKGYPADIAGLETDDIITKVNGNDVSSWNEVKKNIQKSVDVTFEIKRGNDTKEIKITAVSNIFGFSVNTELHKGFVSSLKYSVLKFGAVINSMSITIGGLFTGKLSLNALSGPVGIYSVVGQSAEAGIENVVYLIAFLSINLGFINILPFPAFDGGRVVFLIIEKIKGSPVKPEVENWFHLIGFILLILLMVYITFQDILRLF